MYRSTDPAIIERLDFTVIAVAAILITYILLEYIHRKNQR